ncbi:uncharacterized protein LOC131242978 [Magnolia sinica]|uniref:uncharacterized protein LOC131242978 n=1 Tax=Magnolia sinica TaxID=86752 RepID=UPI002657B17C|nr:uncharacterized protein LOC131242978 [Magnolia sinica]XP_058097985.1 uncharacterized protein LOC131242978 [Magnolia sinica]
MQSSFVARDNISPKYRVSGPFPVPKVGIRKDIGRNFISVRACQTPVTTKRSRQRRSQNIDGEFFVDSKCIDCDVCRWMAPQTFDRIADQSAVFKQPSCEEERLKALQALLCCPTASIHTEKPPRDILEVHKTLPIPINEQKLPGVYHCGYHSEKSYGATSYLIIHPDGNILVDSPSYKERVARNIEMLGGARYMFLTHKDDIADQDKWAKRLKCERIMHSLDVQASTADVEIQLQGDGPWSLGPDFEIIFTPGHTEGSICLLYKPLKALFPGDHLAGGRAGEPALTIFENYNWFSVPEQLNSVQKLLEMDFVWALPGHGRRIEFKDTQEKNLALESFLASKKQVYGVEEAYTKEPAYAK